MHVHECQSIFSTVLTFTCNTNTHAQKVFVSFLSSYHSGHIHTNKHNITMPSARPGSTHRFCFIGRTDGRPAQGSRVAVVIVVVDVAFFSTRTAWSSSMHAYQEAHRRRHDAPRTNVGRIPFSARSVGQTVFVFVCVFFLRSCWKFYTLLM